MSIFWFCSFFFFLHFFLRTLLKSIQCIQTICTKWLLYYQVVAPNTSLTLFYTLLCASLHPQLQNCRLYKNVLHVPIKQLLHYWGYVFSRLDLYARYNQWVMDPNTHHTHFPMWHLCILTLITRKLQVVYGRCTFQTTIASPFLKLWLRPWESALRGNFRNGKVD